VRASRGMLILWRTLDDPQTARGATEINAGHGARIYDIIPRFQRVTSTLHDSKNALCQLWESHLVDQDADGTALIYIDRHLVHEVTSRSVRRAQARRPQTLARAVDRRHRRSHTPTRDWDRGIQDPISRLQVETLDQNIKDTARLTYFRSATSGRASCT